jgi:aminoglycoside phosphotransferase (APT) family kinase protein
MLMDFIPGRMPLADTTKRALVLSLPRRVWRLPDQLAATMVALHRVDPTPIASGLGPSGVPGSSLEWLYSEATRSSSAWLMARAEHLAATRPAFRRSVLCHGDVQPLNLVETPSGCVLLDWTDVQYDDPLFDVATTRMLLHHAPISAGGLSRRPVSALGQTLASRFVTRYERLSGERVDHSRLDWFTRLAALRVFVLLERHILASTSPDPHHPYVRLGPLLLRDLGWPTEGAPTIVSSR